MSKRDISPRKAIKKFSPYVPGKSIEEVKEEYGLKEVIKLASNENLWGTSSRAIERIKKELDRLYLYPQSEPVLLKRALSKKFNISADSFIAGNGTDEIIELIAKTFLSEKDKMLISKNSFIRYKMGGILMGAKVVEVPQNKLRIDLEKIFKKIDNETKLIFIDNPCNPTGTFVSESEIKEFISKIEKLEIPPLVVFDEAYYEYADSNSYDSAVKLLDRNVPLMVLRTFSKIYGLAGLRIGYGISSPGIISLIDRIRPPFNTNRLAQAAALGALEDYEFIAKINSRISEEKEYLYGELKELDLEYVESQTNFILVKFGKEIVESLCEHLLKNGIILRPLKGYSLDDYIRITVGKGQQNEKLISCIREFLS
ncbi:histidinol-phosphate transaminase [Elusimicrobiota bacterium]